MDKRSVALKRIGTIIAYSPKEKFSIIDTILNRFSYRNYLGDLSVNQLVIFAVRLDRELKKI